MVDDIAAQWNELHSTTCRADMDGANAVVTTQRHLDGLYQHALAYATHMYCR
jgi:chorismate mutase